MDLEVISRTPAHGRGYPPIVLIHGAWHGAWCWEGNFLDYLALAGWRVHALSLRGHGKSGGKDRLRWWSIADYVEDVAEVAASLDRTPILVGHSLGGFVAQKYLEHHPAAGAVLLASVPPAGTLGFYLRIIRKYPGAWVRANLMLSPYKIVENPRHTRYWFFSAAISDSLLAEHHARLQEESYRAALDMLVLDLPKPRLATAPVAVLGGAKDRVVSASEVEKTARAYGVEATIFPSMAHHMMAEPNWESVAAWIADWSASVV